MATAPQDGSYAWHEAYHQNLDTKQNLKRRWSEAPDLLKAKGFEEIEGGFEIKCFGGDDIRQRIVWCESGAHEVAS